MKPKTILKRNNIPFKNSPCGLIVQRRYYSSDLFKDFKIFNLDSIMVINPE